jgi:predicted GH43/DUF377 family glycosyl hydrolase
MFRWQKLGRVFDPGEVRDIPWMKDFAQAPSVLVFEKTVRVYFACRPEADASGQFVSYLAYTDFKRDSLLERVGISRQRVLPLGARGAFDEFGTNPISVIRNADEVWAYYAGWTRCESVPFNAAIGLAISRDDGNTFSRIGPGPVLSYSPHEPFVLGSPRIRKFNGKMYLWYVAGSTWIRSGGRPEPVYKIRMATSGDGINWTKHGTNLIPSALDEEECQASPDVLFLNGKYHMFFSYRHTRFKDNGRGYRIGYAWSNDLLTWTRDDAQAGIEAAPGGWDSESVSYGHVIALDGEIYMYYQGNHVGKTGFGLARLESGPGHRS